MDEQRARYEQEARAALATPEGRIEAIRQRAYSRRFGAGNPYAIREAADDEYELLDALATQGAEAARWRALVVDAMKGLADSDDGDLFPLYLRLERALAASPSIVAKPSRAARR